MAEHLAAQVLPQELYAHEMLATLRLLVTDSLCPAGPFGSGVYHRTHYLWMTFVIYFANFGENLLKFANFGENLLKFANFGENL